MLKHPKSVLFAMVLSLIFLSAAVYAGPLTQDKPADTKEILGEIAGDYDFDFQGQAMAINFFEKDGKLFGAPVGETPEEILPVKGSLLKFEVTPASTGQFFELEFVRNEKGVIDKCVLKTMGSEIIGIKRPIKK
ncbi:MAG: hypothetical protein NTV82_10375 [Candidatus Aminicenantes bacterium]|nr:hypothetical protein [Candidatus Aminicenantes bacterium]